MRVFFPEIMLFLILYIIIFYFVGGVDFNFIDVNCGDLGCFVGGGDFGWFVGSGD